MLPAAASLRKQGANRGATTAFLISTPESGVDSIAISYALLDPVMTVIRPVAAFFTAICGGFVENIFFSHKGNDEIYIDRSCPVDGCCDGVDCPEEVHTNHHSLGEKLAFGLRFGYREVWADIVGWFFIGIFLAGIITTVIPNDLMASLLGGGLSSMLVMLLMGIPMYICATASTPVAAALIMKGVSPGAALVFLLVGPATNITSLSVLVGILGKKSTIMYLVVLSGCAVVFGLGVDGFYRFIGISPQAIIGDAAKMVPEFVKTIAAFVLLGLSVRPLISFLSKIALRPNKTVFTSGFPSPHTPCGKEQKSTGKDETNQSNCCQ